MTDTGALEHSRSQLIHHTRDLGVDELDWTLTAKSKSIGEFLVHIAGFEFVIVSALKLNRLGRCEPMLWSKLRQGFAREAGFTPPRKLPLDYYFELMEKVRSSTVNFVENFGTTALRADLDLVGITRYLSSALADTDLDAYSRLSSGLQASFKADSGPSDNFHFDLGMLLILHETYHRGHITLLRYLYRETQNNPAHEASLAVTN